MKSKCDNQSKSVVKSHEDPNVVIKEMCFQEGNEVREEFAYV